MKKDLSDEFLEKEGLTLEVTGVFRGDSYREDCVSCHGELSRKRILHNGKDIHGYCDVCKLQYIYPVSEELQKSLERFKIIGVVGC